MKKQRKKTTLEMFGAVPKGFPIYQISGYMRRVGNATGDNERLKKLLIEGSETFGPAFMFYVYLAWNYSEGRDHAMERLWREAHPYQVCDEVLEMDIVQDPAKLAALLTTPLFRKKPRYIYLVRASDGPYKIGITQDLNTRFAALKTSVHHGIEIIHSFLHEDAEDVERSLHRQFADKRVNGEWYRLDAEDIEYIKSLRSPSDPEKD